MEQLKYSRSFSDLYSSSRRLHIGGIICRNQDLDKAEEPTTPVPWVFIAGTHISPCGYHSKQAEVYGSIFFKYHRSGRAQGELVTERATKTMDPSVWDGDKKPSEWSLQTERT